MFRSLPSCHSSQRSDRNMVGCCVVGSSGEVLQVGRPFCAECQPRATHCSVQLIKIVKTLYSMQGLNDDVCVFQTAISERLGNFCRNMTTTVAGLIIGESCLPGSAPAGVNWPKQKVMIVPLFAAFAKGWELTLVIMATLPALAAVGMSVSIASTKFQVYLSHFMKSLHSCYPIEVALAHGCTSM